MKIPFLNIHESYAELLSEAGFRNIKVCSAAMSDIPNFSSCRLDTDIDGAIRKPDSLYMEASK